MNSVFQSIVNLLRWPLEFFFSEDGYIGSLWHESGRNRSLLLGLPSLLFSIAGVLLLMFAQFGLANKLEGQYQARLEQTAERRLELSRELQRVVRMKMSTNVSKEDATLDELVAPDDPLRVDLVKAQKEERVYLEKLNALNPDDTEYLFKLAQSNMNNRIGSTDNEVGLGMMRKLAPIYEPGYLPAHLFLANWHTVMIKRDAANARRHYQNMKKHLELVLLREPKHESALRRLAVLLYDERAYKQAYQHAYSLFETNPRQFRMAVDINTRLNTEENNVPILRQAAQFLSRKLREMDPSDQDRTRLLLELADCYRFQDEWEKAEQLLLSEIELFSKSNDDASRLLWAKKLLANTYVKWSYKFSDGDYETLKDRLKYLLNAFAYNPEDPECLKMLTRIAHSRFEDLAKQARDRYDAYQHSDAPGVVINELGIDALGNAEHDQALEYFKKAAVLDPKNPEILNNLAYTYLKCSQPDAKLSLTYINRAIQYTPASRAKLYRSNFFDTRARAYMQLGKFTPAIADLTRAWKDRPENVKILEAIVYCHEQDNMAESVGVWKQRLEDARLKEQQGSERQSPSSGNTLSNEAVPNQ